MQTKNKRGNRRSQGLGDTIAKITEATGIAKAVEWMAGEDCGCDERRKKLNELFPYRQPECLTESENEFLTQFYSDAKAVVSHEAQVQLVAIFNRVFHSKKKTSTCAPCVRQLVQDLKIIHNEYNEAKELWVQSQS